MSKANPIFQWESDRRLIASDLVPDAEHRRIGIRALEVGACVHAGQPLTAERLELVLKAASCDDATVMIAASSILNYLAPGNDVAQAAIEQLSQSPEEQKRYAAMVAATTRWSESQLPEELVLKVMRSSLHDPSSKLRMNAAARAMEMNLKVLLPEMITLREMERDSDQQWLDMYVDILRDGYSVDIWREDASVDPMCTVRVRRPDGGLIGGSVLLSKVTSRGKDAYARDLLAQFEAGSKNKDEDATDRDNR